MTYTKDLTDSQIGDWAVKNQFKWDLFISHASEDKESFVKPLAMMLNNIGVKVWYDDFTLKLGDSLSRSIDKGLISSHFGIVVISRNFIDKRWTEYELQGLNTIERSIGEKRIIPIWHNISKDEVIAFSPSLADKIAGDTSRLTVIEITLRLVEIVRPDIFNNLQRRAAYQQMIQNSPLKKVPMNQILANGPIRHDTLPKNIIRRIQIIHFSINDVFPYSLVDRINDFRHDMHPEREVQVWESIVSTYLRVIENKNLELEDKKEVLETLLVASYGPIEEEYFSECRYVTAQMIKEALEDNDFKIDIAK